MIESDEEDEGGVVNEEGGVACENGSSDVEDETKGAKTDETTPITPIPEPVQNGGVATKSPSRQAPMEVNGGMTTATPPRRTTGQS